MPGGLLAGRCFAAEVLAVVRPFALCRTEPCGLARPLPSVAVDARDVPERGHRPAALLSHR
ncbi:hypothetical protein GCM10017752_66050 [Streptomyces roseoviridis]